MRARAVIKYLRLSPRKCRLVADQVRALPVQKALDLLDFSPKKGAIAVKKALNSAIANAEHNQGADIDELWVDRVMVDQAPTLKRFRARAKGRGVRILKRNCHIILSVSDAPRPADKRRGKSS